MSENWLPNFLDEVQTIRFYDPLGAFLNGYTGNNTVEYSFKDVVKMSGHSCPTVAGAYGMVLVAMEELYGEGENAVRGEISIQAPGNETDGAMGPLTQVFTYLTGAASKTGFKGLGGNFVRQGLLTFSGKGDSQDPFYFTREDTGKKVGIKYHPGNAPGNPMMGELMQKSIMNIANEEEKKMFGKLWQDRVKFILVEKAHRKEIFEVL